MNSKPLHVKSKQIEIKNKAMILLSVGRIIGFLGTIGLSISFFMPVEFTHSIGPKHDEIVVEPKIPIKRNNKDPIPLSIDSSILHRKPMIDDSIRLNSGMINNSIIIIPYYTVRDTLHELDQIQDLLEKTKRNYLVYQQNNFDTVSADSLAILNKTLIKVLDSTTFLAGGIITLEEKKEFQDYLKRWLEGYENWDRMAGHPITYNGDSFPIKIGNKISAAYARLNARLAEIDSRQN